jgi:hypothetical protein
MFAFIQKHIRLANIILQNEVQPQLIFFIEIRTHYKHYFALRD